MTAKEFVKAVKEEKQNAMSVYFSNISETKVGQMVQKLINMGVPNEFLFQFVDTILNENCYHLMLALDGEASLGNIQMTYRLFDEDGNELTGSGDIEREAFEQLWLNKLEFEENCDYGRVGYIQKIIGEKTKDVCHY